MADLDISMQDVVSRDEEIDRLEARLAEIQVNESARLGMMFNWER